MAGSRTPHKTVFHREARKEDTQDISAVGIGSKKTFSKLAARTFGIPLWGETKADLWAAFSSHGRIEERISMSVSVVRPGRSHPPSWSTRGVIHHGPWRSGPGKPELTIVMVLKSSQTPFFTLTVDN